ncbi:hypothetical protein BUE93_13710 [Chromobacterium amazonense]|uniref:Uncharacterized protein n=1 Tax=Chromobacterium amazonense TaxID=1382803 RepID=A0A2S9X216_9NEIS|nr:hypothetical protein [Chromobacterium amazonense]PRP69747.1 hypothetical protein BUE93_13710 [Chromobacterium amazonense]
MECKNPIGTISHFLRANNLNGNNTTHETSVFKKLDAPPYAGHADDFYYHVTRLSAVQSIMESGGLQPGNAKTVTEGATLSEHTMDKKMLAMARLMLSFESFETAKKTVMENFMGMSIKYYADQHEYFIESFSQHHASSQYTEEYQALISKMPSEGAGYCKELTGEIKDKKPSITKAKEMVAAIKKDDFLYRITSLAYVRSSYQEAQVNCTGKLYLTGMPGAVEDYASYKKEGGVVTVFRIPKNKIDPSMIHQDPQDYRAIYLTSPLKIEELEHAAVNLDTDTMHNHLNSNTSFNTQH